MQDLHNMARSILEDTFDNEAEEKWINKIVYQHLPNHQKLIFRSKFLKDVPLEELGHKQTRKLKRMIPGSPARGGAQKYASAGILDQN